MSARLTQGKLELSSASVVLVGQVIFKWKSTHIIKSEHKEEKQFERFALMIKIRKR
jgi:hypothetical protein